MRTSKIILLFCQLDFIVVDNSSVSDQRHLTLWPLNMRFIRVFSWYSLTLWGMYETTRKQRTDLTAKWAPNKMSIFGLKKRLKLTWRGALVMVNEGGLLNVSLRAKRPAQAQMLVCPSVLRSQEAHFSPQGLIRRRSARETERWVVNSCRLSVFIRKVVFVCYYCFSVSTHIFDVIIWLRRGW